MPLISKETLTKIWAPDPFEPDPWAWARGWHRRVWHWAKRNPRTALLVGSLSVGVALLALLIADWNPYKAQREAFAPLFTLVAGLAIAGVTLMRHFAQTEADRQRRITDTFSKAVEQLSSDKIEARLGGIYTLERLAGEALDGSRDADRNLYWTVMETLTAFVRERARWQEPDPRASETVGRISPALTSTRRVLTALPSAGRILKAPTFVKRV